MRIQLKDHIDRCKKRKQEKEREDYHYSGSENEDEEPQTAGEPSSIIQAPGGDTLRRNFQQIQEGRIAEANGAPTRNQKPQPQQQLSRDKSHEEPAAVAVARPVLPQRVIVVPDPPVVQQIQQPPPPTQNQHANRPLPPTPKNGSSSSNSNQSSSQSQSQQAQQQTPPQRNSQNAFKPMVSQSFLFHDNKNSFHFDVVISIDIYLHTYTLFFIYIYSNLAIINFFIIFFIYFLFSFHMC